MREAHAAGGHLRAHQGRDSGAAGTMGEGRRGSVSCGHFRHSRIQGLARLNVSSSDAASDSSIREGWRRAALSASAPAAQDSLTSMLGQCVNQTHLAEPVFAHPILQLQKTIGNQAVQDLLRSCAIQAKLAISQPGDPYEDEADRIAGQVMRMPDMPIQRTCSEGASGASTCSACERKEQMVVRRRTDQSSARAGSIADDFVRNLGPGQPLDSATRVHFEPRFHRDFGDVRVHAGSRAAEMARQIHARAFTAGPNIVFGRDQYQPQSRARQRLLAHELAHTLQQREGGFLMIQGVSSPISQASKPSRRHQTAARPPAPCASRLMRPRQRRPVG